MDTKINGTSSKAGPSATSNGNGSLNKTPGVATIRKIPGGIKVNTVKRSAPLPRVQSIPSTNSFSSPTPTPRINGLSEEKRQRVEEIRRERERKKREEEERLRPPKPSSTVPKIKRHKLSRKGTDDDDDDSLFSSGTETSSKKRKKNKSSSLNAPITNVGQGYQKLGRSGVLPMYLVPRQLYDEEAFGGNNNREDRAIQSSTLVAGKRYGPFFTNLNEEQSKVSLEYPAPGCSEEFSLLVPKDRDEYDPISDLLRTVQCIVDFYLTPEQQGLFGSLEALETGSAAGHLLGTANRAVSSSRETSVLGSESTLPSSASLLAATLSNNVGTPKESTPVPGDHLSVSSPRPAPSTPISPARSIAVVGATPIASPHSTDSPNNSTIDNDSILRSFTKARNRRDGLLFIRTVDRFNSALVTLREAGKIQENVKRMGEIGVSEGVWRCLQEQCYARTVSPRVEELSKYEAFSDNVYGELLPRFMSEIAQLTHLGPDSVFVDLGSGVGNLLIQVAVQTGSESHGCEQMKVPSELSALQVEEAKRRWKMWGIRGGSLQSWQGDFGEDDQVRQVLRRADVILVNNYAFTAPTNDKLSWQFLDLKDGAQVISLKPFVPPDFRLTERTLSSPLAILRVAQRTYTSGCVSWADGGGKYYLHTVDRSMIAAFLDARDAGALAKGDVRKRQWKAALESSEEDDK